VDAAQRGATGAARAERAARLRGLHVLADDDPRWARGPLEQARAACRGGAAVVQLRAKHAADAVALGWAEAIRAETRAAGALFVVNDRFDLALASGADGVHLGQEDLPPARLPAAALERLLIGRSTHTWEEALAAAGEPVDYLAFGPLFPTASKASAHAARGLELLREVAARAAPRPVIAIGGIDAERAVDALRAGAAGVAVIAAVAGAEDAEAAVRGLVAALAGARPPA
jgi:thiamine-phosphate pyrophosphorylase